MNRVLLTGGFGYVGSHTAAFLAEKSDYFVIYDNFYNSKYSVIERLEKTTSKKIDYIEGDINDTNKHHTERNR